MIINFSTSIWLQIYGILIYQKSLKKIIKTLLMTIFNIFFIKFFLLYNYFMFQKLSIETWNLPTFLQTNHVMYVYVILGLQEKLLNFLMIWQNMWSLDFTEPQKWCWVLKNMIQVWTYGQLVVHYMNWLVASLYFNQNTIWS